MATGSATDNLPRGRRFGRPVALIILACLTFAAGMAVRALMVSVPPQPAPGLALKNVPQGVTLHHVNGEDVWIDRSGSQLTAFLDSAQHMNHGVVFCAAQNVFMSPMHGELFDRHGVALDGPASRGLDRFPVTVEKVKGESWVMIDTSNASFGVPKVAWEDRHLYVSRELLDRYDAGGGSGICGGG